MEVQEPVLRSLEAVIGFPVAARFPDVRGTLADELKRAFACEQWYFEGDIVGVAKEDDRFDFVIWPVMAMMVDEGPSEVDQAAERTQRYFHLVADLLKIDKVEHAGATTKWTCAIDRPDEVREWLFDRVGLQLNRELFQPFGGRPSEVEWTATFESEQLSSTVEVEVMSADEAAEEQFLNLEDTDLPPALLFVETTRSWEPDSAQDAASLNPENAIAQSLELLRRNIELSSRFLQLLTEA
jgi:hypothetical protein